MNIPIPQSVDDPVCYLLWYYKLSVQGAINLMTDTLIADSIFQVVDELLLLGLAIY